MLQEGAAAVRWEQFILLILVLNMIVIEISCQGREIQDKIIETRCKNP